MHSVYIMSSRWLLCVQEDDATVVRGGLQSHHPDLQPHQSRLVPENTRVSLLVSQYPGQKKDPSDGNTSVSFVSKPECGWALCFRGYQRAAVRAQGSRQRSSRGTCWSTWHRTGHQNLRSGFSESKSMTCLRPGEHDEHSGVKSLLCCQLCNYSPVIFSTIL